MPKEEFYTSKKFSLKKKLGILLAIIIFLSAGGVIIFFRYQSYKKSLMLYRKNRNLKIINENNFANIKYYLVYSLINDDKKEILKKISLDKKEESLLKIDEELLTNNLDFQKNKKYLDGEFDKVFSKDKTIIAEKSFSNGIYYIWLDKLWESGKEKLIQFNNGYNPFLIGFSNDADKLFFVLQDITGVLIPEINILDLNKKEIVKKINFKDKGDRILTPVLFNKDDLLLSSIWRNVGEFAKKDFKAFLVLNNLKENTEETISEGKDYLFSNLVWSPSSEVFAYSQTQIKGGDNYSLGMFIYKVANKKIIKIREQGFPVYWTPDNRYLIFLMKKKDNKQNSIWAYDFKSSKDILLVPNVEGQIKYFSFVEK